MAKVLTIKYDRSWPVADGRQRETFSVTVQLEPGGDTAASAYQRARQEVNDARAEAEAFRKRGPVGEVR